MLERTFYTIGALLRVFPFAVLGYLPLADRLKISKKQLVFCILAFMAMIAILLNIFYPIKTGWWYPCFGVVVVICLILFALSVNVHYTKSFFIYLFVMHYTSFVIGTTNYFYMILHLKTSGLLESFIGYDVLYLCLLGLSSFSTIHLLYFRIKQILKINNNKVWRYLWIIPFVYTISFAAFCFATTNNILSIWQYLLITFSVNFSAFIVYLLILKMIVHTEENAVLRESAKSTAMQLSFEEEQYKNLRKNIEEAKAARHDLRHHLSVIKTLIKANDIENLNTYINQYMQSVPDNGKLMICENCAVNAIVQHYLELAGSQGIKTEVQIHIPQQISASSMDLCIVFGNLIENAIEACARMRPANSEKYIRISAKLQGKILGITVDNSFDGQINRINEKMISSKRNGEAGIGISSIKAVVEKYHGHTVFTAAQNEFQASLMLNLP